MLRVFTTIMLMVIALTVPAQSIFQGKVINGISSPSLQKEFYHYQVFELDISGIHRATSQKNGATPFRLHLGKEMHWDVDLQAYDIRSPQYQVQLASGTTHLLAKSQEIKTYRGSSGKGDVRLTIKEDFLYGFLEDNGEKVFIEPLRYYVKGAPADQVVVYRESDVNRELGGTCALLKGEEVEHPPHREIPDGGEKVGLCYEVEIALAADFGLFNNFGSVSATEGFMLGVLNTVQSNYDDEFDDEILFIVSTIFVADCFNCDPWTSSTDAGDLLNSFRDWGNSGGFGSASFDVATLWTERNLDGSTIGVAWVGSICTNLRYNVCERFLSNINLLRVLQAHELGHNFNSNHDADGAPFIMAPSVSNTNDWSNSSQNTISNYIDFKANDPGCFSPCVPAGPPVASIFIPTTNICPGSVIPIIDNSSNNPTDWDWQFIGGNPASSNQQHNLVQYNNPGTYPVVLTVSSINGVDATSTDITVGDNGVKYLVYETFENGPTFWEFDNPDNEETWQLGTVGGSQYGSRAMYVDNFNYDAIGQVDGLISQPLNFSGEGQITLEVDYAYARYNNSLKDQLRIKVSTDNGASYPFTLFTGDENGSGNFATAPDIQSPFLPFAANDWCFGTDFGANCISLDLSSFGGEDQVRIKIENVNGFGNNLYIDNIRVIGSCQPIQAPQAAFSSTNSIGCAPLSVSFQDESVGPVDDRQWNFPGGSPLSSNSPDPSVVYPTPGVYNVTLVVSNVGGTSVAEEINYVVVEGPPETEFFYDIQNQTVFFDNFTTNANSYLWDFGDGSTSTENNPSHQYLSEGTYTVTLTATNNCGSSTFEQTFTITSPIMAGFSPNQVSGCAPLEVTFTDQSQGNVTGWLWTFEGGTPGTSTDQNPTVTYNQAGTFDVTLVVSNDFGENIITQNDLIMVGDVPTAGFSYNNNLGETSVTFTNNSLNANSYEWEFGDGASSNETNPVHDFPGDGTYDVTLTATNDCGEQTFGQTITIMTPPTGGFSTNTTNGCPPFEVQFTNESMGTDLSFQWTFEGGTPASSSDSDPVVTYNNSGVFDVTLVVTNIAGESTVQENDLIIVGQDPDAGFDFSNNTGETNVSFMNTSQAADSYLWIFEGGVESTEENPSYDFPGDGTYTVTLTAFNGCGEDTYTEEITILTPPVGGFTFSPTTGCTPFEVQFTNTSEGTDLTFDWTFEGGDPATSNDPDPLVSYSTPGTYDVTLVVTNAAGESTVEEIDLVVVGQGPTSNFNYDNTLGETTVNFTNTSQNSNTFIWIFENGAESTEVNPNYDFEEDGIYTVLLIASNDCGNDTTSQEITILTPPLGGFTSSQANGCIPFEVQFSDASDGTDLSYQWTFEGGDPSSSTEPDPLVTYSTPGTFDVTLVVTNAAGESMVVENDLVVVGEGPDAGFDYDNDLGETTVNFTNTSQNSDSYLWIFEDGAESSDLNPTYDFTGDGTYTVFLIAYNDCGEDTISQEITILTPPEGNFSASVTSGCLPFEVQFTNTSTGSDLTYTWTFEGGNPASSTDENPLVIYSTPGVFDVTLTVTNAAGESVVEAMELIEVTEGPTAAFDLTQNIGESTVALTDQSDNASNLLWDFGGLGQSTDPDPDFDFEEEGTYLITLIASNNCGSDTTSQEVTIILPPQASFQVNNTSGCVPVEIQFTGTASGSGATYAWSFEGGQPATSDEANPTVTYTEPGSFNVQLIVANAAGADTLTEEAFVTIIDSPEAEFEAQTNGFFVQFLNQSAGGGTYLWDFGDGTDSDLENPNHTYSEEGTYIVTLSVMNDCGEASYSQTIVVDSNLPVVEFGLENNEGCAQLSVQFFDQTENSDSLQWSFPGGTPFISNDPNPVVVYDEPGIYSVNLIAYNGSGSSSVTMSEAVTVGGIPEPGFSVDIQNGTAVFTNETLYGTTFEWDFGDGNGSAETSPVHEYSAIGNFIVSLIATNDCGSDTLLLDVLVEGTTPSAVFESDMTTICASDTIQFWDASTGNPETWFWEFPGGSPNSSNMQNPFVTYSAAGTYPVSLTVSNNFGSETGQMVDYITVIKNPVALFHFTLDGSTVYFESTITGDTFEYDWNFGDEQTGSGVSIAHQYEASGTYEVTLVVSNECGADTISREIEVLINAVDDPEWVEDVRLFPNPTTGTFTLELEGKGEQRIGLRVLNIIGQQITQEYHDFSAGYLQKTYDLEYLPVGVYLLEIANGSRAVYRKVVVE